MDNLPNVFEAHFDQGGSQQNLYDKADAHDSGPLADYGPFFPALPENIRGCQHMDTNKGGNVAVSHVDQVRLAAGEDVAAT